MLPCISAVPVLVRRRPLPPRLILDIICIRGAVEFERTRGRNVRNTDGHDVVLKYACDDDSVVSWVFYPALEKE